MERMSAGAARCWPGPAHRGPLLWLGLLCAIVPIDLHGADKGKTVDLNADPHLVGRWKLNETTGKQAADASGRGHPGVLRGAATFDINAVREQDRQGLRLSGGEDCVLITGYKGIPGTQPRTIAAWVKPTAAGGEIVAWGHRDFGKMCTFGFIRGRVGLTPHGGYLYMKTGVDNGAWHHVAAVVRAADPPNLHDHVTLYLDGQVAEIDDIGLLDLWPIDTGEDLDVRIGRGFKGVLADVRLYDRALSEDEIRGLCNQAK